MSCSRDAISEATSSRLCPLCTLCCMQCHQRHVYKLIIAPLSRVYKSWCCIDPMVLLMERSLIVALSLIMLLPRPWWRDHRWWLKPTGSPGLPPGSDQPNPRCTLSPSPALVHHLHWHWNSSSPSRTLLEMATPPTRSNLARCFSRKTASPRVSCHLIPSLLCFLRMLAMRDPVSRINTMKF